MSLYHKKQDYEEERTKRENEKKKLKWNRDRDRAEEEDEYGRRNLLQLHRTWLFFLQEKPIISIAGTVSFWLWLCFFRCGLRHDWSCTVDVMSKSWSDGLNQSFLVCPWWTVKLHKSPLFYLFFWRGSFFAVTCGSGFINYEKTPSAKEN